MQILGPNKIKLELNERVFELIRLIKPTHAGDRCRFLEGPIWTEATRKYKGRLVSRMYHLINHHCYKVSHGTGVNSSHTYLRVSGRGNVNCITKEEAMEAVRSSGYISDADLIKLPQDDNPEIPYLTVNCDY